MPLGRTCVLSEAYEHAEALARYEGAKVVYIGEPRDGATADARFFDLLDRDWFELETIEIQQFWGLYDSASVYVRRARRKSRKEKT